MCGPYFLDKMIQGWYEIEYRCFFFFFFCIWGLIWWHFPGKLLHCKKNEIHFFNASGNKTLRSTRFVLINTLRQSVFFVC